MELEIKQDGRQRGDALMSEDSSLLEQAERGQIGPVLRFYEWAEPTISLGFHQSFDILDMDSIQSDEMAWTRRPTGGAAVLHSEELTYAIVLSHSGNRAVGNELQEYVSLALAEGLRKMGVYADVSARGEPLSALRNRASCFVRTSRWEVTVGGKKIIGSAQRNKPTAILQHGSILIGKDHLRIADYLKMDSEESRSVLRHQLAQKATCIEDELGHSVEIQELRKAMAEAFAEVFAAYPVPARDEAA